MVFLLHRVAACDMINSQAFIILFHFLLILIMETILAAAKELLMPPLRLPQVPVKNRYTFREIRDQSELEHFFHLRYSVYLNSRMKGFLKENTHYIDMDIYDLHALHFGLLCENQPIGYLRLVLHKSAHYNSEVLDIGKKYGVYSETTHSKSALLRWNYPDFPFLNYPHVPESMIEYYQNSTNKRAGFVEASRLVVLSDFRQNCTAKYLVECAITVWKTQFIHSKEAVINCIKRHATFYTGYGFSAIAHSEGAYVAGSTITRVMLSFTNIPPHMHSLVEQMVDEFTQTGKIIREL
jgi:predicted GNAT family N-acyltransferase